jgi:hypothetical protein
VPLIPSAWSRRGTSCPISTIARTPMVGGLHDAFSKFDAVDRALMFGFDDHGGTPITDRPTTAGRDCLRAQRPVRLDWAAARMVPHTFADSDTVSARSARTFLRSIWMIEPASDVALRARNNVRTRCAARACSSWPTSSRGHRPFEKLGLANLRALDFVLPNH